jgi:hypothetical protein
MIITLALEFGPTTHFISLETGFQYGEIGQAIRFKIYDSQGELVCTSQPLITSNSQLFEISRRHLNCTEDDSRALRVFLH